MEYSKCGAVVFLVAMAFFAPVKGKIQDYYTSQPESHLSDDREKTIYVGKQ